MSGELRGREVGVLGLARSGRAAARLALARGARVYASDAGDGDAVREAAEEVRRLGGDAETGGHDLDRLAACDLVVLSPGIPPNVPVLRDARVARVPRIAEVELAWRELDAPVAAVTGTNGKTTVTGLIAHLLTAAGMDAPAAGNIGTPLSEVALRDDAPDAVAVEVSSFQLADVDRFAPEVGVVTNLAPDHLDRYASLEAYYADKARLFRNATERSVWVLNGDDVDVLALPGEAPGRRLLFRVDSGPANGEAGGWLGEDGALRLRLHADDPEEELVDAGEMRLLGRHNAANALAAALAARLLGAPLDAVREGLRTFEAPAHRLQPVAERDGVLWIDDSKATNVASARVSLRAMERPVVLLLGGRHKGEPYTALLPELEGRARAVVAFGEAGERVERDLAPHLHVERVRGSFDDAVAAAERLARPGDAVLLAPACSSYDMFRDYQERGERFAALAAREAAR